MTTITAQTCTAMTDSNSADAFGIDNAALYLAYPTDKTLAASVTDPADAYCPYTVTGTPTLGGIQWINDGLDGLVLYVNQAQDHLGEGGANPNTATITFGGHSSQLRTWSSLEVTGLSPLTKFLVGKASATSGDSWTLRGLNFMATYAAAPTYMWFDAWEASAVGDTDADVLKVLAPAAADICTDLEPVWGAGGVALLPVEVEEAGAATQIKHTQCTSHAMYMAWDAAGGNSGLLEHAVWQAAATTTNRVEVASTRAYSETAGGAGGAWTVYTLEVGDKAATDPDGFTQVHFWYLGNQKTLVYGAVDFAAAGSDASGGHERLLGCFGATSTVFKRYYSWTWDDTHAFADVPLTDDTAGWCKEVAGLDHEYVVINAKATGRPGCFAFSDSDAIDWRSDAVQVLERDQGDCSAFASYTEDTLAIYQSKYQADLHFPVYQADWTNEDQDIVDWGLLDFAAVWQRDEGRAGKTDADCVTIEGRSHGAGASVAVTLEFTALEEVTTVQYNIPTGGVEITARGESNDYLCATTSQQGDVYNWGRADCAPPQYDLMRSLVFSYTNDEDAPEGQAPEFQICGVIVNRGRDEAPAWNYWFVNPWSEGELLGINLNAADPCAAAESIFDGSGYAEYEIAAAADPADAYTITHQSCADGASELRYDLAAGAQAEQFTTAAFGTGTISDTQGNAFAATEDGTKAGLYKFTQEAYSLFDKAGVTRSYSWYWYFGYGVVEGQDALFTQPVSSVGCYEHETEVFTDVIMFGADMWSGYTAEDCANVAGLMGYDFAVVTGNGVTDEACYGVGRDAAEAMFDGRARVSASNCQDWCDSVAAAYCGGRDYAEIFQLFEDGDPSAPVYAFPDEPEEPVPESPEYVAPERTPPADPVAPALPAAPVVVDPPSEESDDEDVAAGARIAIATATALSALAISA